MSKARQWLGLSIVLFALGWGSVGQCADKYPSRAIDLICPFGAGGSSDATNRFIADYLKNVWKVPVNMISKPGGATVPASLEIYNADPDGYTLLADTSATSMLPIAVKEVPFNVLERTFVATIFSFPQIFVVPADSPIKTMKDLEAEVKKSPETFTWTSMGGTGSQDFTARQFFKAIGVDVFKTKPVVGKGGGDAATLTAGGHVVMGIVAPNTGLPMIKGEIIRPLAITTEKRIAMYPDLPTTAEVGYPTVNFGQWGGVSGPPNMPPAIVEVWDKAIQDMVKDPKFISKLDSMGVLVVYKNAKDTRDFVIKETQEVKDLWGVK
jgi:tripartite-type tricarboxylate transporter receptor subunit TctC